MSVSCLLRCVLPAAAVFSLGAPEGFAQEEGRMQGRVFLEGTREPVAGAVVRADPPMFRPDGTREDMAKPVETVTDDTGRFALTWIRSGIWDTTVAAEGFFDSVLRIEVTQGRSHACSRTEQQNCKGPIEFHMARVKSEAALEVEQVLGQVEVPNFELEQATADLTAADAAYNSRDYRTAIAGYDKLLATWPQMTALHQDIGDAHRQLVEFEEAIAAYDRFRAAEPDNAAIERKIARTRLLMGDLDAAEDLAAMGGAASREDLYNLGEVEFHKGNIAAAAGWYEKAVAADPSWQRPVFKLGLVALNRGEIEGAKTQFQKVIDLAPDSEEGAQAKAMLAALP